MLCMHVYIKVCACLFLYNTHARCMIRTEYNSHAWKQHNRSVIASSPTSLTVGGNYSSLFLPLGITIEACLMMISHCEGCVE